MIYMVEAADGTIVEALNPEEYSAVGTARAYTSRHSVETRVWKLDTDGREVVWESWRYGWHGRVRFPR